MALLNYTTSISADKTIGEIQQKLARAGAAAILTEYDSNGQVSALSFKIHTRFGLVPYRVPCDVTAICKVLNQQGAKGEIPRKFINDTDQARRVGWRILKDWIEAQLAIVETQMVELSQVFLPYAQSDNGQTLYERIVDKNFNGLLLE